MMNLIDIGTFSSIVRDEGTRLLNKLRDCKLSFLNCPRPTSNCTRQLKTAVVSKMDPAETTLTSLKLNVALKCHDIDQREVGAFRSRRKDCFFPSENYSLPFR